MEHHRLDGISILQSSIKTTLIRAIPFRHRDISILQSSIKTANVPNGLFPLAYFNSTKFD